MATRQQSREVKEFKLCLDTNKKGKRRRQPSYETTEDVIPAPAPRTVRPAPVRRKKKHKKVLPLVAMICLVFFGVSMSKYYVSVAAESEEGSDKTPNWAIAKFLNLKPDFGIATADESKLMESQAPATFEPIGKVIDGEVSMESAETDSKKTAVVATVEETEEVPGFPATAQSAPALQVEKVQVVATSAPAETKVQTSEQLQAESAEAAAAVEGEIPSGEAQLPAVATVESKQVVATAAPNISEEESEDDEEEEEGEEEGEEEFTEDDEEESDSSQPQSGIVLATDDLLTTPVGENAPSAPQQPVVTEEGPRISAYGPGTSYVYNLSASDKKKIAKLIYLEARGECYEGKVAVACVVLNRLTTSVPGFDQRSVESIIYQKNAFRNDIENVSQGMLDSVPDIEPAVEDACLGWDPTRAMFENGALYYYAPKYVKGYQKQIREGIRYLQIGNHNFHIDFNK